MVIPPKEWKNLSGKPRYPNPDATYSFDPTKFIPIADTERDGRWILQTDQAKLWLWNPTVIELATLVEQNEYKAVQVMFPRVENRTHVVLVKEKLQ